MKIVRLALIGLCVLWASFASAQAWPTKPVKIIVPFTAGSATDILARTFGQKLSEYWAQPVVIENRPGAGGTIGTGIVANAPPDGYTLLVHSAAYSVNPSLYPDLPFDTRKAFVEIAPRTTYYFSPISAALPHVKEGKLVAIGVSSAQRSSVLKDVPTIAESSVP